MVYAKRVLLALLTVSAALSGCNGGNDSPDSPSVPPAQATKFVQTWGTAGGYATTTATLPYFPSIANQTTGITAPGIALGLIVTTSGKYGFNLYNTPWIVVYAYLIKQVTNGAK